MKYSYIPESAAGHEAYDPFAVTRKPFPAPRRHSREPAPTVLKTGSQERNGHRDSDRYIETPHPVLALAEFARGQGWQVRVQYSRGHFPHGTTGKPSVLKDLVAVRFGGHGHTPRQAYAVYSRNASGGAWTWSSVMVWGPDLPPYGGTDTGLGFTELKAYLMMCADSSAEALASWVGDLKAIHANGMDMQKRRDLARKQIRQAANEADALMAPLTNWPARVLTAWVLIADRMQSWSLSYGPEDIQKIIDTRRSTDREGRR